MEQPNQPVIPVDDHFKLMADTAPVMIWISGQDKSCYFFNAGWLSFTGRTMEQESGNGWTEGVHPDDLQRCLDIYHLHFDARKEFKMEYRLKRHDDEYHWLLDHGVPRYTANGIFAGYIGSCMDIDELLKSERLKNELISVSALEKEQALNEELASSNEELASTNEELLSINDVLSQAQENLHTLNNELEQRVLSRTQALTESEAAAQALNEELTATVEELSLTREKLINNVKNLHNMVLQAPVGMCIIKGQPLMVEEVNDLFLEIIGKERNQFDNIPYWVVNAEAAPYYEPITHRVMETGETYRANEHEITLIRKGKPEKVHIDFVYEPIRDVDDKVESIMIVAIEVTDKVTARKTVEDSAAEFQVLNEELAAVNEEFAAANEELAATNEEMEAVNEELTATNEELIQTQESLQQSERLFKSIALNIPKSLIMVIDKEHRYVTIEGDIMQKMGYNSKDYAGKHPTEVGPPERYAANRPLFERVLGGEQFSMEHKAQTGGNYMVHFVPLKNEDGEVDRGLIIVLDITDIKDAEEKSAKLAAIIESSDDAIISKTLESVITSWNDSAQRIFGYTADEIIGETIYRLIPPDRQDEEPQILARLKTGERVEHFETKRVTKDGRLIDVSVTVSPVKGPQGNIIGLSKIARDITERKLDESRKNDFIGMVSHELKTPLTSLNAIIQVANAKLKTSNDTFLSGAMEKANIQVKRMTGMINGFLNISRLEAGKILIDKQLFELDKLLHEIVDETQLIQTTHAIHLTECGPVKINADRDKISSVISNLVSNAIKYSPKGKYIEINCSTSEKTVILSVKDEGMGIKPHDLDKIFDRYYRVETDHTRHISGFGIGLYLSSEIIKRHNGNIWAESESGVGSTFYFTLPLE